MPCIGYRPQIGEIVFVSLSGNLPLLITVTGYHYHSYLKEEVMDYERLDGQSTWSTYKNQEFFTEVPVNTPYIYVVVGNEDFEDQWQTCIEDSFHFEPQAAFDRLDALEKERKPRDDFDYIVEVRKVT